MNRDISQTEMKMQMSASKAKILADSNSKESIEPRTIDKSDLGSLINSPTVNLYKTSYKIKGGGIPRATRINN
jgi:hypothetical protein